METVGDFIYIDSKITADGDCMTAAMKLKDSCFLTHIQVSQETGKVIWYSHLFKNYPQFVVNHTVKGFSVVNEAKVDLAFFAILLLFP